MPFEKGTQVRRIDNPAKVGVTTGQARLRGALQFYGVRWLDGTIDYVAEDQLEATADSQYDDPYEAIQAGRYGRAPDLRRSLTHVHLAGRLANLVYSMGVSNTDFYPHQYKPLLTLLESPANGLLIADEVGLGKTIEAGIIWTELRAREDMRRLLVVCPAMLREKWRDELRLRFGIDARIVNARELLDELGQTSSSGPLRAWISSYQALRPPRTWKSGAEQGKKPSARAQLASMLDNNGSDDPLLDLVVFDEAHYMRNSETTANYLGELLREVSQYRVLLSATPINLASEDLFQLLKLCDPDHFQYSAAFHEMLASNRPLVQARDAILRRGSSPEEILGLIREASESPLLRNSRQLAAMLEDPPTAEKLASPAYRVELASSMERVNLLGHVVTRTRKRDVQLKRPRREVKPEQVPMTDAERAFYVYVTEVTRDFAYRRGISDGFLLATPQRQVCSCPAAFAEAWLGQDQTWIDEVAESVSEDLEDADDDSEFEDISSTLKEFLVANRPRNVDVRQLRASDSKFLRLIQELGDFFDAHPTEKVILFTSFRATARYLTERLAASKIPAMLLWGNMSESKQELINTFRDDGDIRVLVSTEVASEGVDLQFSRLLINYDLPWNPMRVEQRIGRIDRLGQKADVIHIWNLFYKDTIDERILGRLLTRLKVFEGALGEPEPVIGEQIQKLEAKLLTEKLTPEQEEREIERTQQVLEEIRHRQEQLEQNAAQMIAHGGLVLDRIAAANELARRVTEADLVVYVRDFLARHVPGHQFQQLEDGEIFVIALNPEHGAELDLFCSRNALTGQTSLGSGFPQKCRFVNSVTSPKQKGVETIHQFHPLVRYIADKLNKLDEAFYPLVAVSLSGPLDKPVKPGDYMFAVRRWSFHGVKMEEWLQVATCDLDRREILDDETADFLVNSARLRGENWLEAQHQVSTEVAQSCLDDLETHLGELYARASRRKQDENLDRLMFQLHAIDQHLKNRLAVMENVRDRHVAAGRASLAKAEQAKMDRLSARMDSKRRQILQRERVVPDQALVCAGLIRVL